jgi:hypothetical protein
LVNIGYDNVHRGALCANVFAVDVCKAAAHAVVEGGAGSDSEGVVLANRPAACPDCAGLRWRTIELELVVCDDGADTQYGVSQHSVLERADKCVCGDLLNALVSKLDHVDFPHQECVRFLRSHACVLTTLGVCRL